MILVNRANKERRDGRKERTEGRTERKGESEGRREGGTQGERTRKRRQRAQATENGKIERGERKRGVHLRLGDCARHCTDPLVC